MRKRGADTCTDCLKANTDLCIASQTRNAELAVQDDGGNDSDGSTVVAEVVGGRMLDGYGSDDILALVSQMTLVEEKISKARLHVLQYQAQRGMTRYVIAVAKNDVFNKLIIQFRRKIITIDMGQNLGLPKSEGE